MKTLIFAFVCSTATIDPRTGEITLKSIADAFGVALLKITANDGQSVNNTYEAGMTLTILEVAEVITSLHDKESDELQVFPNPVSTRVLSVKFPSTISKGTLTINDITGREVLRDTVTGKDSGIDVSTLPPGLYFLKLLLDGKGSTAVKVVIE